MKTAHTPGPWCWEKARTMYHLGAPESERRGLLISTPISSDAEDGANRALIAASPDLLAACETLADYFAGHDPNDIPAECGSGVRAALIQARAAIAKARGE